MTTKRSLLLTFAVVAAFTIPSVAQQQKSFEEGSVYLFSPDGQMIKRKMDLQQHPEILGAFQPMKTGTLVYVRDGKVYMVQDQKMQNGAMLTNVIYGGNCILSPGTQSYTSCTSD